MSKTAPTLARYRSRLAPVSLLASGAFLVAALIAALGAPRSDASSARGAMLSIVIKASAPSFPKQLPTGLISVTLVNDTKSEATAGLASVAPGATLAQVKVARAASQKSIAGFLQLLKLLAFIGGPQQVQPGASETAVLDLWRPGLYGANVQAGNANHLLVFKVTAGSGQAATLPAANVTLKLKDFKLLGLPKHLATGNVSFQLANTGKQAHELEVVRLDAGKTQKDLLAFAESPQGQNGPPPTWVHDVGGLDTISSQRSAEVTISFTPGYYVLFCAMPDVKKTNGEPHFMEGMIGNLTVS
jgi:hypothetical protein